MTPMTDAEVTEALLSDTPLNRARRALSSCIGRAQKAEAQLPPPTAVEIRRQEFEGVAMILAAYGVQTTAPEPRKIPADKGNYGGSCNRIACLAPGARWLNRYTDAHYCATCARAINRATPEGFPVGSGKPAVIEVAPAEEAVA